MTGSLGVAASPRHIPCNLEISLRWAEIPSRRNNITAIGFVEELFTEFTEAVNETTLMA